MLNNYLLHPPLCVLIFFSLLVTASEFDFTLDCAVINHILSTPIVMQLEMKCGFIQFFVFYITLPSYIVDITISGIPHHKT